MNTIKLYPRENGTGGVRNRIAVISTVACANHVAEQIAAQIPEADAYTHPYGCDQLGADLTLSFDCLVKMGTHPNVGAALVVGLGCEEIKAERGERYTIKQMEKMRKNLQTRLEKLNDTSRKDDVVTFEQLGVDRLFVDESHFYKNLIIRS
mgnify:CR=1 FL=1